MDKQKNLFAEVNAIVGGYRNNVIELMQGLTYSQYQTIRTIEFYYNSRYLGGNIDKLGREKPFYNINKFRTNVAMRATDIDIKDVSITADTPKFQVQSFILNHELYNWMKEADFGCTLNEIGQTLPKYGGVLVKKCIEKEEGEPEMLEVEVVAWKNVVTDQIDIDNGTKIEQHWMSPKELWDKEGVWENISEAVNLAQLERSNVTQQSVGMTKGTDKKVQILEIEGYFANDNNPEVTNSDSNKYRLMNFIIANNGEEYVYLYGEELEESRYKYQAWDAIPGRGLGAGVVEDGFEAQVWTNDAIQSQKNAMDLAGKVMLKTNSKKVGSNILTDAENGRIFELEDGKDITPINLTPSALQMYAPLIQSWDAQYERVSSTFNDLIL